ncbi:GntR family transcriptional regulator [Neoroseomonas oryzicola]|uniref:GntR family transcriptional regulator n=1 Tax=Neoroseomonas oryzicola TaxID=535904 RepID=A0A9X9WKG7_9PROT|nr:GntR family transcriptional regulator [Neoroseomonas oryzicola]MBR0660827.1 GntR family transcriptional regulator [Neoroseomonas oryzicola]NKE19604.1 GntR family transcriptional regulator [Neoroseomonas oryzicola]
MKTAAVDLSRSAVARYLQLATLFRRRIEQGTWRRDERIPTVDELAAECGVARATIRQALDQLEQDGLIARYRAKGTFVRAAPEANRLWCEVETDWSGLLRSREGAEIEILGDRPDQPADALPTVDIGRPAPRYHHVRRRHWRDGQPFLLADVWLDERLWPKVTANDLRTRTALKLVAGIPGVRIADARQVLTIGTADVETAAGLQVPLNAPVAFVRRAAVNPSGTLLMVADGIYRGDVVRIDIKLR